MAASAHLAQIEFTQFLRPDGRQVCVSINRPDDIATKAHRIIAAGYRFECEHLITGHVSLTIARDDEDHAIEVVENGPDVPAAVDRLITNFEPRFKKSETA